MGIWSNHYKPNGSLSQQTDALGNVVAFDYDGTGRVAHKWHGSTLDTTYTYGTSGRQNGLLCHPRMHG